MRLNFRYEDLLKLGEEFKSAIQGRMRWGDTLFLTLGRDENKCLVVWTPKQTSERDHLPGFYTDDGKFFMKVKEKPGAWVTYADLGQIRRKIEAEQNSRPRKSYGNFDNLGSESSETLDKAGQEVLQGVRELERNTKNIVDFAGGIVPEFTVTHRGRPIKLADLLRRSEEFNVDLRLLRGFKTGAYIVITPHETTQENSLFAAEIIIPEKTISAGVHLNADELIARLSDEHKCFATAIYSSYLRQYPDFQDFQHYFHLREQLEEAKVFAKFTLERCEGLTDAKGLRTSEILLGEAVHDPINRDGITLKVFSVTSDNKKIEQLIADAEKPLSEYFEKVNEKIASISEIHQGRVRERVGMWNVGRNIISSILDETPAEEQATTQGSPAVQRIVSEETKSAITDFMDFSFQLFEQHFQPQTTEKLTQELRNYHELISIVEEERGYISSGDLNNFIGKATALVHDGVMEEQFVQTGAITPIDIKIFEDGKEISQIDFPLTASWEIEVMPETLSLSTTQRRRHAELLSQTLDIENSARRSGYGLREVLNPLYEILLSVNSAGEFEINAETFAQAIEQIRLYRRDIRECILSAPSDSRDYYAKLSVIISKGEFRELLCQRIGYFEGMTLSNSEEVSDLLTSIQTGELIKLDEREQSQFLKNLEVEVETRTGKKLASFKNEKLLKIHCDEVLNAIKVALQKCLETLDADVKDLTDTMNLDDKQLLNKLKRRYGGGRGRGRSKSVKVSMEDVYAERQRINVSLEQIIDGKAAIQDCLTRLEQHTDVVSQLLNKLRAQPDLPIFEWPQEIEVEPELPITEAETPKEVEEMAEGEAELEVTEEATPVERSEIPIVGEVVAATVEELPSETIELSRIAAEQPPEFIPGEVETGLPEVPVDYDAVVSEVTEEVLSEALEEIEEHAPVVTLVQETARQEILPAEIPSVEELQQEFSLLSSKEIHEAVDAGLSGKELKEYLELRAETAKKDEVYVTPETKPAQITKTWQELIDIEQYPNIRAFLQVKQLKLTTTGRQLSNLKRISDEVSHEGQILLAEILELRDNNYSREVITSLISYLTDELRQWESYNITEKQLPPFTRQRVLSFYVCYEKDISELLNIAMRYESLINDTSPLQPEYKKLEEQYLELIETL